MAAYGVPGIEYAFIDQGGVVEEGGIGVKTIGKADPVDAHTRFMIASNTKGMTTLLLAKLVDRGKLGWDEPVVEADPAFRLGDASVQREIEISPFDLRLHRHAAPGHGMDHDRRPRYTRQQGSLAARGDETDHQVWRDVPV
ncbi:serine hydrolase [Sphingomonas aurantiaca]|uniref:serine hydrolase n=1 Tax=Sphingomonas aurantiaca TaxID=185949 RepID=UPI003A5C4EB8